MVKSEDISKESNDSFSIYKTVLSIACKILSRRGQYVYTKDIQGYNAEIKSQAKWEEFILSLVKISKEFDNEK